MSSDPRSGRIAVVADALLATRLPELREAGYGVMQLPPSGLAEEVAADWLLQTAEQIAEFLRNGYEVVLVDDDAWAAKLADALGGVGLAPLPRYEA